MAFMISIFEAIMANNAAGIHSAIVALNDYLIKELLVYPFETNLAQTERSYSPLQSYNKLG